MYTCKQNYEKHCCMSNLWTNWCMMTSSNGNIFRVKVRSHMRGRARAEAGGKLASTQIITCVHTCAVAERWRSGSKNRSARNGSNTQFAASASKPRAPNHHCPQEMTDPLRVCVNIPAVAEREFQNPPASAPQPPRACVNVALSGRVRVIGNFPGLTEICRFSTVINPYTAERGYWQTNSKLILATHYSDVIMITMAS